MLFGSQICPLRDPKSFDVLPNGCDWCHNNLFFSTHFEQVHQILITAKSFTYKVHISMMSSLRFTPISCPKRCERIPAYASLVQNATLLCHPAAYSLVTEADTIILAQMHLQLTHKSRRLLMLVHSQCRPF